MENINNPGDTSNPSPFDQFKKAGEDSRPLPGSFRSVPESEQIKPEVVVNSKFFEPISYPYLIAQYSAFREKFHPKDDVVYYPCMANDTTPSLAFPDSRVIYVDLDKDYVEGLKKAGFEAHTASALEFDPGQVDILIMLNPQISPDIPASHVVENGFVLCNNWHNTAFKLHKNTDFKISAVLSSDSNKQPEVDTDNLDDYWKRVENEEELKERSISFYEQAVNIVKTFTGKTENIFAEYKKIIEAAKERMRQHNAKMIEEYPNYAEILPDPDRIDFFDFEHMGQTIHISEFPYKKIGEIYVFQKISKQNK